ncbi:MULTISPECIES: nitrite reductase large subunit NirB [Paenarthrobacter]|uniref:nitrite reductase large subunit NirB n=1 Tax=Paenarthrobacter TaxID=1742992 RepID=UPI0006FAE3C0|nr:MULTISPECIES: nitrite reductase large subunit NirB [Paenarthrobacter]KQR01593.1 nitrite reductase [Arthrobacter sp. Leaf145]SKB46823.1 assimilatory nitrite reductase (NAD(P)H) large subunit precursor [Arthrobacter sp. 31Cvi3.1E]BCW39808.1 putative nitrite reductase [Arthrobacter sp. StoSoilB3]MBP2393274.1 nitrite reductase (NADH) large subunit [Paenarthrobacter nicotinovorans]QOT21973.1 nitrite reductase large subunit [Paenarthrobacter sp. YJN-D]
MTGHTSSTVTPRRVVVIGGGPAAHRFTDAMVNRGLEGWQLTVLTEEAHLPYDRVALSKALTETDVDLTLGDASMWDHQAVELKTGERAVRIDPVARNVVTAAGNVYGYDHLVVATGSDAARLPIPGSEHTHVYRTLEDVWSINKAIEELTAKLGRKVNAVTIGGGLLGLESAAGTEQLGATPVVINGSPWLMNTQLDEGAGQALGRLIAAKGFEVHGGVFPSEVKTDDDGQVTGVLMADGRTIDADLVIVAIGVRPRDELFRAAEGEEQLFSLGQRGGVVINDFCATEVEGIWAIGEVANFEGMCLGLVAPANTMAEIVADRLHGGEATFPGFDTATKLKLSGVDVASFGDAFARTEHALEIVYADPARGVYQKIVTTDDAKTLLGGIFVGDASPYMSLRPLLGRELSAEPGAYLSAAGGGEAPETELPDDAILCSCNNVAAGTIRDTINGCGACEGNAPVQELSELKGCTRAGTQCGSCVPMLKKLLEGELTKSGIEVSKALCEHISLSRQELFDAIRVLELTSFEDIMAKYGTGAGCDICKPTIASILASQHSAYVLDAGRGSLQDTNDRALANMQKDGTYSVVPRIAGGEITPKGLGVIAAVAEKYNLYTKITGGQRIDMFGARLEQLPDIWKELVDAGFESGQAYGKSLRTVKSCVGSTWCRFGVQDSVAMAIALELRYRGLRSPHKLKMGVSGCARECAEARGKDVGVIATADGWNLYVGGNGGATPAHAKLLAKDLDDETLLKYIDRYLMYYIRTADRLQRTARWQEELDGDIKHVEDVVVHDSLGIAAELEAAMAKHIDTYEDEWAETLKDPERLRRFRSFVNAPNQKDESISFVPERGQIRPATNEEKGGVLIASTIPVRSE